MIFHHVLPPYAGRRRVRCCQGSRIRDQRLNLMKVWQLESSPVLRGVPASKPRRVVAERLSYHSDLMREP